MLTRLPLVDRERLRLVLALICAAVFGIVVGVQPTAGIVVAAVAAGAIACLLLPLRHLPTLLLAVTIVMPSLVLEGVGGSGQARAVILILLLGLLRVAMARTRVAVPGILPLALGAALGLTLLTALVASSRPPTEVGSTADLQRDLSFPFAAVVGFLGGASARSERTSLSIARGFGFLAFVAALLSIWYWAWRTSGVTPLSSPLFNLADATFSSSPRSVFPFAVDFPNIGAVLFVMLGALAAPPLLLAAAARDRAFGLVVVIISLAAVLTTQSRTGLFAATAAALTYLALVKRGGGRRSTVLVTLVLLGVAGAYVFTTFPAERASADTLQARLQIWGQAERAFLHAPIIGHGYDYSLKGNFVEGYSLGVVSHVQSTHSDLLSNLVDGGVVGAAIFIAVLWLMVVVARWAVADPLVRPLGIGYACMLSALVVGGIDNTLSQSAAVATLNWMAFGVMVGLTGVASGALRR
jgi:O-antigen ligase